MSVLAFDCETSGLVIRDRPANDPAQPRVVQLAFVVDDHTRSRVHTYSTLIQPQGWEIVADAARAHGYSTEDCARYGVPAKVALANLVSALRTVRIVVAHNLGFDSVLVQRELEIAQAADPGLTRPRLRRICTMKTGTALMPDGKYPKLDRLHETLTGREHEDAHDALADATATMVCFWGLVDRRMIEL